MNITLIYPDNTEKLINWHTCPRIHEQIFVGEKGYKVVNVRHYIELNAGLSIKVYLINL